MIPLERKMKIVITISSILSLFLSCIYYSNRNVNEKEKSSEFRLSNFKYIRKIDIKECMSLKVKNTLWKVVLSENKCNWNINMVQCALHNDSSISRGAKVKVAVIDSGVNWSSDIDVRERKDFIEEKNKEEYYSNALYEDFSGHGTGVAGIIAAKDNNEDITGINPNVDIYSARVLDYKNTSPISRVIEAVNWAIEKEVQIINMSFTTDINSTELHNVLRKAYNKGILIIAAAGNGTLEYPARYDEVMAVGSVGQNGIVSDFSPSGCEIVAPGELIASTDVFETISTGTGTSFAAPHVTGIASRLWEQDLTCSNKFIRSVLDISANLYGDESYYGFGLVDYEYANKVFHRLKHLDKKENEFEGLLKCGLKDLKIKNSNCIPIYDKSCLVSETWNSDIHQTYLSNFEILSPEARSFVMLGCIVSDYRNISKWNGMYKHPLFHGYPFLKIRRTGIQHLWIRMEILRTM